MEAARYRRAEKKKKEEKGKTSEVKEKVKMLYWNVAGLMKKNRDFWRYVEDFDAVGLIETWIEK